MGRENISNLFNVFLVFSLRNAENFLQLIVLQGEINEIMHAKFLVQGRFSTNIILCLPFTILAFSPQDGSTSPYWPESSTLPLA